MYYEKLAFEKKKKSEEACALEPTTGVARSFITTALVLQSSNIGSVAVFGSSLLRVQFELLATPRTSLSPGCHVRCLRVRF